MQMNAPAALLDLSTMKLRLTSHARTFWLDDSGDMHMYGRKWDPFYAENEGDFALSTDQKPSGSSTLARSCKA